MPTCHPQYAFNFSSSSEAPKAVKAWRAELEAKKRIRLASTVADPSENPEAFEEGWEQALAHEADVRQKTGVNGVA